MAGTWDVMAPVPNNEGAGARGLLADGSIWAVPIINSKIRLYRYDDEADSWSSAIDSPTGSGWDRSLFVDVCAIDGLILFFNGTTWTRAYDYVANSWITGLTACPTLTDSRACIGIKRTAYCFGGLNSSAVPQEWAFSYEIDQEGASPWTQLDDVPWPASVDGNVGGAHNQTGICAREGRIHFLQGLNDGPEHIRGTHKGYHLSYNIETGDYTVEQATADLQRRGLGCDGNRRFIAVGGQIDPGSAAFDTDTLLHGNTWVDQAVSHPQNSGTNKLNLLAHKGYFWSVGGDFDANADAESLCRYTAPFELIDPTEGWGIISA